MSNKTQSDGFGWDELWAGWNSQPLHIKREWMLGYLNGSDGGKKFRSEGLQIMLTDIMKYSSDKVKDEVFEFAPKDVQKHFGYLVEKKPTQTQTFSGWRDMKDLDSNTKERLMRILEA